MSQVHNVTHVPVHSPLSRFAVAVVFQEIRVALRFGTVNQQCTSVRRLLRPPYGRSPEGLFSKGGCCRTELQWERVPNLVAQCLQNPAHLDVKPPFCRNEAAQLPRSRLFVHVDKFWLADNWGIGGLTGGAGASTRGNCGSFTDGDTNFTQRYPV
jgi:hypothetical protein